MNIFFTKKTFIKVLLVLPFSFTLLSNGYSQKNKSSWQYKTIVHDLLEKEALLSRFSKKQRVQYLTPAFLLTDQIMENALKKIDSLPKTGTEKEQAEKALAAIDLLLQDMNFIACENVNNFIEALSPRKFREFSSTKFRYNHQYEKYRQDSSTSFYGFDDDLGAIVYYAIGQLTSLPIAIFELPEHYMIRWELKNGGHINWEVVTAKVITDEAIAQGNTSFYTFKMSDEEAELGHYMHPMYTPEIISYYDIILAKSLSFDERYIGAIEHFEQAIKERPYAPKAYNDFAYMLLTTPALKSRQLYNRAYGLSQEVDRVIPSYKPYKSTYACACAAIGNFKKAIELERSGLNDPVRLDGFKKGMNCLDIIERWVE